LIAIQELLETKIACFLNGTEKESNPLVSKCLFYGFLEVSMSELSRRMNVSVMTISNAVQRGEKIVKELNISFF